MIPNFVLVFVTNLVGSALFGNLKGDGQLHTGKWQKIQLLFMKCINTMNVIVMGRTHA